MVNKLHQGLVFMFEHYPPVKSLRFSLSSVCFYDWNLLALHPPWSCIYVLNVMVNKLHRMIEHHGP